MSRERVRLRNKFPKQFQCSSCRHRSASWRIGCACDDRNPTKRFIGAWRLLEAKSTPAIVTTTSWSTMSWKIPYGRLRLSCVQAAQNRKDSATASKKSSQVLEVQLDPDPRQHRQ